MKSQTTITASVSLGDRPEIDGSIDANGLFMLTEHAQGMHWFLFGTVDAMEALADAIQTAIEYRRLHAGKTPKASLDAMRKHVADEMFGRRIEAQQEGCPQTA